MNLPQFFDGLTLEVKTLASSREQAERIINLAFTKAIITDIAAVHRNKS